MPSGFTPSTRCSPLATYRGPAPGTTYVYSRQDGSFSSRLIVSSENARIVFQYRNISDPAQQALPNSVALAGLYLSHDPATSPRAIHYQTDPVAALETLSVSQSVTVPTTETSTIRGKARTLTFPTITTYRRCGTLTVQGRRMPVRVYEVTTSRRVVERSGREQVRTSHVTYYQSNDTGYPVAFQDSTTTVVARIEMPAYSR